MSNGLIIGLIAVMMILIGMVSNEVGLTNGTTITLPGVENSDTNDGGFTWDWGWFQPIADAITPITSALGAFFSIMTFQADIPGIVTILLFYPIMFYMSYTIIRLVRGGG